ncbi:response regulator [Micropruina sp.]|uniref:response regulator n=1 Tax=Micropruina sp. TaxID=2737536 RepID=UPI0039E2A13D
MRAFITVMIVDDDLLVRRTVQQLLREHPDMRVLATFANGHDALAALSTSQPDIMLVDMAMPYLSGGELTRMIKKDYPEIHILAYTSLSDQQSVADMLTAGAAGVVYKEASIDAVADAIRATCAGLAVLSPRFSQKLKRPYVDTPLSDTEVEILRLLTRGMSNEQISTQVRLSANTVKYHLNRLCEKLGAHNRVTLAVAATRLGVDT